MIKRIKTLNDVKKFAEDLIEEGVAFHPDEDFKNYINVKDSTPAFSENEAKIRNKLMDKSFEICIKEEEDIYKIMNEVYANHINS